MWLSRCLSTQALEDEVCIHQSTVTSLNAKGQDIVSQSSSPDSGLIKERMDSLNRRWKNVCSEVASRKEL